MNYIDALELLSSFHLGAALLAKDDTILKINEAGCQLLHGSSTLEGTDINQAAPGLLSPDSSKHYYNISFAEYLELCPVPEHLIEHPEDTRLICFRSAASEVSQHMLHTIVNLIPDPLVLCDEKQRVLLINDSTMKMESLMQENVYGKDITEAYHCSSSEINGQDYPELTVPLVLESRRPIRNCRQTYQTYQGRQLNIMCDSYPIFHGEDILGVFCLTANSSHLENLTNRVLDLQEQLLAQKRSVKLAKKSPLAARYHFHDIIFQSSAMHRVIQKCMMCAKSDSSVMIYGETGTGKELIAQSIHNASSRKDGPFLAINCAAIPENLLESMLFGTEKGAYTGAESRAGLFEQAHGGTLLLDELNSMSMTLQAKLLRVLQDHMVRRVGGIHEKEVNVRVISNINIPPYQAIKENKLREDIFYRLGVVSINLPPLRERKDDIPILARSFFTRMNQKLNRSVSSISGEALALFYSYHWPGNIRELQHCIEHALNIIPPDETVIQSKYLPDHVLNQSHRDVYQEADSESLEEILTGVEKGILNSTLASCQGNISQAAKKLGISRQNLQHRIKRLELDTDTNLA